MSCGLDLSETMERHQQRRTKGVRCPSMSRMDDKGGINGDKSLAPRPINKSGRATSDYLLRCYSYRQSNCRRRRLTHKERLVRRMVQCSGTLGRTTMGWNFVALVRSNGVHRLSHPWKGVFPTLVSSWPLDVFWKIRSCTVVIVLGNRFFVCVSLSLCTVTRTWCPPLITDACDINRMTEANSCDRTRLVKFILTALWHAHEFHKNNIDSMIPISIWTRQSARILITWSSVVFESRQLWQISDQCLQFLTLKILADLIGSRALHFVWMTVYSRKVQG